VEVIRPSAVADPDRDDGSRIDRLEGVRSFTGAPLSARDATLRLDVVAFDFAEVSPEKFRIFRTRPVR
jgi:hypothetical protein